MSATNEALMEKIRLLTLELSRRRAEGIDVSEIITQLNELNQQASAAQSALNESKLLKG
jgi:hypothetical protein